MSEGKPDFRARLSLEIQNSLIGRSTVQPIAQTQAPTADAFQPASAPQPLSSQPQPLPQASMQPPAPQLQPMQMPMQIPMQMQMQMPMQMQMQMPMQQQQQQQQPPQQALYAQQRATYYAGGPLYAQQTQSPQYAPIHRMQTPAGMMQMQTGPTSSVVAGTYAMPLQPQPQLQSQSHAYAPMQMPQMPMQMSSRMMQQPTSLLQASNPQVTHTCILRNTSACTVQLACSYCNM